MSHAPGNNQSGKGKGKSRDNSKDEIPGKAPSGRARKAGAGSYSVRESDSEVDPAYEARLVDSDLKRAKHESKNATGSVSSSRSASKMRSRANSGTMGPFVPQGSSGSRIGSLSPDRTNLGLFGNLPFPANSSRSGTTSPVITPLQSRARSITPSPPTSTRHYRSTSNPTNFSSVSPSRGHTRSSPSVGTVSPRNSTTFRPPGVHPSPPDPYHPAGTQSGPLDSHSRSPGGSRGGSPRGRPDPGQGGSGGGTGGGASAS